MQPVRYEEKGEISWRRTQAWIKTTSPPMYQRR